VGSLPVVEGLPFGKSVGDVGSGEVDGRPELLERGPLDPLDFAVEVRRARPDRAELDAPFAQPVLDVVGEELLAAVGLDPLDGERHLLDDALEEVERAPGVLAGVRGEHLEVGAVVDGGVLGQGGKHGRNPTLSAPAQAASCSGAGRWSRRSRRRLSGAAGPAPVQE
jgi:hypothetical protein